MLEHYATTILLGNEKHKHMLKEAATLHMIPHRKHVVVCRICRAMGNLFIKTGNALLDATVHSAEAAR